MHGVQGEHHSCAFQPPLTVPPPLPNTAQVGIALWAVGTAMIGLLYLASLWRFFRFVEQDNVQPARYGRSIRNWKACMCSAGLATMVAGFVGVAYPVRLPLPSAPPVDVLPAQKAVDGFASRCIAAIACGALPACGRCELALSLKRPFARAPLPCLARSTCRPRPRGPSPSSSVRSSCSRSSAAARGLTSTGRTDRSGRKTTRPGCGC